MLRARALLASSRESRSMFHVPSPITGTGRMVGSGPNARVFIDRSICREAAPGKYRRSPVAPRRRSRDRGAHETEHLWNDLAFGRRARRVADRRARAGEEA